LKCTKIEAKLLLMLPPTVPDIIRPTVSPAARDLIRQGAEALFDLPPSWFTDLEDAGFDGGPMAPAADNPVILAAARRTNLASLQHWASANIQNPGQPVPPYVPPDMESIAIELTRRGQREILLNSARSLQNAAWRLCMRVGFGLTTDPALLEEMFSVCFESICDFVDGNFQIVSEIVDREENALSRDSHVEKWNLVSRILDGTAQDLDRLGLRLGYAFHTSHTGAILWSQNGDVTVAALEQIVQSVARAVSNVPPLVVFLSPSTVWVWFGTEKAPVTEQIARILRKHPSVHMATGELHYGCEGFRDTHFQALEVQKLLGRLRSDRQLVSFEQVQLISLMGHDQKAAERFMTTVLGDLRQAPPAIRHALRSYLACGCNAAETAKKLNTHRNTLLRRIEKAASLLPRPLEAARTNLALALELDAWL
jgi:DNA-binding PucR family transcriptional regulator